MVEAGNGKEQIDETSWEDSHFKKKWICVWRTGYGEGAIAINHKTISSMLRASFSGVHHSARRAQNKFSTSSYCHE